MATKLTTDWVRPTSVGPENFATNINLAYDGDVNTAGTVTTTLGGSGQVGYLQGFENSTSLPSNAIIIGFEVNSKFGTTGSAQDSRVSNIQFGYRHPTYGKILYMGSILQRTGAAGVGYTAHASMQRAGFYLTPASLSNFVVFLYESGSGVGGQTIIGTYYDVQVRFTYIVPDGGKKFSISPAYNASSFTSVTGGGSGTVAWSGPNNALYPDGSVASLATSSASQLLLGASFTPSLASTVTPISLVENIAFGSGNLQYGFGFGYQPNGGSVTSGGTAITPSGWFGAGALFDSGVTPATLNAPFGFGMYKTSSLFNSDATQIDALRVQIVYEELAGGMMLVSGL